MARTTSASVEGILLAAYDGTSSLTPFIDSATSIVDQVSSCATRRGVSLTTAQLELIERWLAAHLYAMSDQIAESERNLNASVKYQGKTEMNLDSTKYGQTAKMMDHSGCLNALGNRKVARVIWLGRAPSEQTAYEDRD